MSLFRNLQCWLELCLNSEDRFVRCSIVQLAKITQHSADLIHSIHLFRFLAHFPCRGPHFSIPHSIDQESLTKQPKQCLGHKMIHLAQKLRNLDSPLDGCPLLSGRLCNIKLRFKIEQKSENVFNKF